MEPAEGQERPLPICPGQEDKGMGPGLLLSHPASRAQLDPFLGPGICPPDRQMHTPVGCLGGENPLTSASWDSSPI